MADRTLTLALHGEVSLVTFAEAISHWRGLVDAITDEVAYGQRIQWVVDDLSAGSATATIRAVTEDPVVADPVVHAYIEVGDALRTGHPRQLKPAVRTEAVALTGLLNGDVDYLRFETAEHDAVITTNYNTLLEQVLAEFEAEAPAPVVLPAALGGVLGRIQTLSSRGGLRFTLYDSLFDRAVSCYLREGQEEIMRDVWGETATVEGVITRDPKSGRPLNVRHVWNVTPARRVERTAYTVARGAITRNKDDVRQPEELVSAARDE